MCDYIDKTIVIIKSEHNQIFGGYADQQWNDHDEYIKG